MGNCVSPPGSLLPPAADDSPHAPGGLSKNEKNSSAIAPSPLTYTRLSTFLTSHPQCSPSKLLTSLSHRILISLSLPLTLPLTSLFTSIITSLTFTQPSLLLFYLLGGSLNENVINEIIVNPETELNYDNEKYIKFIKKYNIESTLLPTSLSNVTDIFSKSLSKILLSETGINPLQLLKNEIFLHPSTPSLKNTVVYLIDKSWYNNFLKYKEEVKGGGGGGKRPGYCLNDVVLEGGEFEFIGREEFMYIKKSFGTSPTIKRKTTETGKLEISSTLRTITFIRPQKPYLTFSGPKTFINNVKQLIEYLEPNLEKLKDWKMRIWSSSEIIIILQGSKNEITTEYENVEFREEEDVISVEITTTERWLRMTPVIEEGWGPEVGENVDVRLKNSNWYPGVILDNTASRHKVKWYENGRSIKGYTSLSGLAPSGSYYHESSYRPQKNLSHFFPQALKLPGLPNMGNTCYIAAALQCLKVLPGFEGFFGGEEWKGDVNKVNVLGYGGEIAKGEIAIGRGKKGAETNRQRGRDG
ncbi:hypothetical protein TL16_g12115 [Triparma laevis f. inornata]|uniref:Ubiquitinyl hydrolase 1 n=1 Tax=Triparma laevis f. inornata TaxID=1714386 RepID=A0A9W7BJP8_9STRA|nr:hypothetical protein TL16_g12115 [Triparma laevis f. inornata]